jgi:hypothetical protein
VPTLEELVKRKPTCVCEDLPDETGELLYETLAGSKLTAAEREPEASVVVPNLRIPSNRWIRIATSFCQNMRSSEAPPGFFVRTARVTEIRNDRATASIKHWARVMQRANRGFQDELCTAFETKTKPHTTNTVRGKTGRQAPSTRVIRAQRQREGLPADSS